MKSSRNKTLRMENLRRVVQVLAFLAFIYLFLLTVGVYDPAAKQNVLTSRAPIDTFFRIDPLLGLVTMVSTRQVIHIMLVYALPVVVLTIVAGRFFCGWLCPMGVALDATDRLFYRRRRASHRSPSHRPKYYILAGMLIAALFSAQVAYFLDPITIITRAFTFVVYPLVQTAAILGGLKNPLIPVDVAYHFRLNFLTAIVFVAILAAESLSRRYWCRNLCPLGALLGVLSKFSFIKRTVTAKCVNCGKCAPDCKVGAINIDPLNYKSSECVYCYSCTDICPTLATSIVPKLRSEQYHPELDLSRRRVFQAAGIGALVAVLGKTNPASKTSRNGKTLISSPELIRPPGALPEDQFVDRCLRCSECMKVCPTSGLQPAITEAGFEGLWSPVLVPRIGECAEKCNLCSQVCSSQAIQPFEMEEKKHIFIGRAVIDRSQCIAWNSDKQCLVCDECCSYHALYWKTVDGVKRPFVEEHKCVGCGICESACPIQPVAAIRVFSLGDRRLQTRAQQKAFFDMAPKNPGEQRPEGSPYG